MAEDTKKATKHGYAERLRCDGFYATAGDTQERKSEEELARARGLELRELKAIEGALLGIDDKGE